MACSTCSMAVVQSSNLLYCLQEGFLKITAGEGYIQPDRENGGADPKLVACVFDVFFRELLASVSHGCIGSEGNYIFSGYDSYSADCMGTEHSMLLLAFSVCLHSFRFIIGKHFPLKTYCKMFAVALQFIE